MTIQLESPDQADVIDLIDALHAYQLTLYPPESMYSLDLDALMEPNVLFAVARDQAGLAIACGALLLTPEFGEIKSMYVRPENRGQGWARKILILLENQGVAKGCQQINLETGPEQPEAIALYSKLGYRRRGPFGDYEDDPLSFFMHKWVGEQEIQQQQQQ